MTSFLDMEAVAAVAPLKEASYPFARAEQLHEALRWCITDYYAKASLGKEFEARGLMVTGQSRLGKTHEVKKLLTSFHAENIKMPSGQPARIITILLSRRMTWKDLGLAVLEALDYPLNGRRSQNYIWARVIDEAKRLGVIGIYFDECQHVFSKDNHKTNRNFLDSFKTLMKDARWPIMLILSGVPELAGYVRSEEQLARLLRPVEFDEIRLPRDLQEMNNLAYSFADKAELCFDELSTENFLKRLSFACANRWGLVIELIVEAFALCRRSGETSCTIDHFSKSFSLMYGTPFGYSPFEVEDYEAAFDPIVLLEHLTNDD
ncbi:ATP-binding protein [Thioclava sp. IC9]|uniref:ATP-binding protein n=1 Tax=Thioclava sp. IC9 TaxID=1973007 RepID=UPI000B54833E|nr:ATP-binding protein [Thioclava sp. IC9]OWX99276.1 hypothetical protein B6V76_17680 [Thioclava sp. IC9]